MKLTCGCLAFLAALIASDANGDERQTIEALFPSGLNQLNQWLTDPDQAPVLLATALPLDLEALARRSFGKYYTALDTDESQTLLAHLERRLSADIAQHLRQIGLGELQVTAEPVEDNRARLNFTGAQLEGKLVKGDNGWRLVDLAPKGKWLAAHYKKLCRDILKQKYSLPVLLAKLDGREYIILEDFSTSQPGQLPKDWRWRERDEDKAKPYQVEKVNGKYVLAAADTGNSVILLKYAHWNPRKFPIMTWCWRADALPPNGDEHFDSTNDSAAGIYVIFSRKWIKALKQIKYVWSTTVPVGKVGRRNRFLRPYFFVVESGAENLGKWVFEQVDLVADHKRVMGGDTPDKRTLGLGILSDANSTKSLAKAYYADFRVWSREALEQGRIENHCACYNSDSVGTTPMGVHAAKEHE